MKKLFLIIAVAALTAVGATSARAGVRFSFGLPLPPLPPLPGLSFGAPAYGYAYPGYGYGYPGYSYGYPGYGYGYGPVYRPYYGYGPRAYIAPRPWGWGRYGGRGYRPYYRRW